MHRIAVIGTGYVGLVGGAGLADFGNMVVCVDRIEDKIETLTRGEIPFYEPGLSEVVTRNVREGRLSFTTDFARAVAENDVVFCAVVAFLMGLLVRFAWPEEPEREGAQD